MKMSNKDLSSLADTTKATTTKINDINEENIFNENADIRLIGNERYTQIPISKFINDDKKNLSDDKMGLIPLPLRNMKRQSKAQELYKIQRSLVRMRRLQYDKMRRKKDYDNEFIERIIYIQRWWKKIILTNKTKKIQINYKLYKIRKKIKRNK